MTTSAEARREVTEPAPRERTSRAPRDLPPGVEYHRVLAGPERRVGRGILAILLVLGGLQVFSTLLSVGVSLIEARRGYTTPALGGTDYTPLYHAVSFGSVGLLIPWSMLVQRWLYGVPAASLHSVASRFRFEVFGRALLVLGPVVVAVLVVNDYLAPAETASMTRTTVLWLFVTSLVLAPLQSAGEEYGVRGLVFRVASSWGRGRRVALLLGLLVPSVAFAVIHLSTDPWLNLWYLVFGVTTGTIVWRTGGLEIAVVLHALFNTIGFTLDAALRTSFVSSGDRANGAAGPYLLIGMLVWIAVAVVVHVRTRRTGPALTPVLVP